MNNVEEDFITKTVKDGTYFKTGREWFFEKYTSSYISKNNLIFMMISLFLIMTVFVLSSMFSVLSVKAANGVINIEGEFDDIFVMQKIPKYYNNNEKNILRFIAQHYITNFESYTIDKFNIYQLNEKISQVKKYSNKSVGDKFDKIAKINYIPEIFAGIYRESKIVSFEFVENEGNILTKGLNYIFPVKSPNKAIVNITTGIYRNLDKVLLKEENHVIEIIFKYNPLKRNKNDAFLDLNFQVVGYNYLSL